jgi:hypothetical protein
MDDHGSERADKRKPIACRRSLANYLVAALGYGLAVALIVVNVVHTPRSEDYGGVGLKILGFVIIPLWLLSGTIALLGSARAGFWFAVSPILLALAIVGLADLLG